MMFFFCRLSIVGRLEAAATSLLCTSGGELFMVMTVYPQGKICIFFLSVSQVDQFRANNWSVREEEHYLVWSYYY